MKNIISQIIFLTTSLIFHSCGSNSNNTTKQPNATTIENTQQKIEPLKNQETIKPKEYYIGDTIDEGSWKFCVNRFEEGKTYNNGLLLPESGEKYVTLDCSLQNTSQEIINYSMGSWLLGDQDGYEYDLEWMGDKRPSFSTGDLESGKKKRGFVTFHCPKEAKNFELHFDPIFHPGEGSTYTIKLFK